MAGQKKYSLKPSYLSITYTAGDMLTNFSLPRKYVVSDTTIIIGRADHRAFASEEMMGNWVKVKNGYEIHLHAKCNDKRIKEILESLAYAEREMIKYHSHLESTPIKIYSETDKEIKYWHKLRYWLKRIPD